MFFQLYLNFFCLPTETRLTPLFFTSCRRQEGGPMTRGITVNTDMSPRGKPTPCGDCRHDSTKREWQLTGGGLSGDGEPELEDDDDSDSSGGAFLRIFSGGGPSSSSSDDEDEEPDGAGGACFLLAALLPSCRSSMDGDSSRLLHAKHRDTQTTGICNANREFTKILHL